MKTHFTTFPRRAPILRQIMEGRVSSAMRGLVALVLVTPIFNESAQASTFLWTSSGGSAWLTGSNWGGSVPTAADIGQFGTSPTGAGAGINFASTTNAGTQVNGQRIEDVGAIEVTSDRSASLSIGNSSSTVGAIGTLRLLGVTVNGVNNVVLRSNATGGILSIKNTFGAGTQTMSVALGNAADNIVNIDGAGGITIDSIVKDASTAAHLTLDGGGTGVLTLSGANTYTGGTTVATGQLRVTNTTGSAAGTAGVTIGDNTGVATLSGTGIVTGLVTTATTGANIAHIAPGVNQGTTNFGTAGTLHLDGGLTIGTGSALDFDIASTIAGTNDLISLNNTTLTLGSAFTVNYNEFTPGLLATSGNYTLISGVSNPVDLTGITIISIGLTAGSVTYTPTYSFSAGALLVSFSSVGAPTPNYFDTNGSTAGIGINGGTAVWDTTTTNWNPVSTGDGITKVFQPAQTAYFGASGGGTAGIVTVGVGGVSADNGIQFDVTGYSLTGGAITMGGTAPTITVLNPGDSATISSTLSGSAGLAKGGSGTLVLDGVNDFTGTVAVNSGTLSVGSDGNLGDAANALVFGGGTFTTTAGIAAARNITITAAGGGGTFNTNGFDSSTTGTTAINDAFKKSGSGDLSLDNFVNFGAGAALTVSGGSLTFGQFSGVLTMFGGATLNGNLIVKNAIRLNFNGVYSGSGQIQTQTSGTSLANSGTTSGVTVTIGNQIVLNSLNLAGFFVTNLGPVGAGIMTVDGVISGSSDLNIAGGGSGGGTGTITLNAQNTYTGATTINLAGQTTTSTVKLGIDNALPMATDLSFNTNATASGTTLDLNGHNQTVASLSYGGANGSATTSKFIITNNGGTDATFTVNGATSSTNAFAGVISDGATNKVSLVKGGTGTLGLSGANTHSGGTTINGGTLSVSADAALGAAAGVVAINNNATLQAAGTVSVTDRTLTLGSGGGKIDTNGLDVTFDTGSTITGGVGDVLEVLGTGTLTLAGTQSYHTLTTSDGTTNVESALLSGATVIANATTNFGTSQTLAALNIGAAPSLPFATVTSDVEFAAAVPEPSAIGLLALGALGVLGRRRRR